jgi:anti-sigma factor RsiW
MMRCPQTIVLQDYLDELLALDEASDVREHVAECAHCASALARYRVLYGALGSMPLAEPSPSLTDRVLARVAPAALRRRWVATVGWSYAGALAACLLAVVVWGTQPQARSFVAWLSTEAWDRLLHSLLFVVNGVSFLVLSLSSGWGLLAAAGARLQPLGRALSSLISHPSVGLALWLAAVSCAAVLWWMRPRHGRTGKGIRHVGVLGF